MILMTSDGKRIILAALRMFINSQVYIVDKLNDGRIKLQIHNDIETAEKMIKILEEGSRKTLGK